MTWHVVLLYLSWYGKAPEYEWKIRAQGLAENSDSVLGTLFLSSRNSSGFHRTLTIHSVVEPFSSQQVWQFVPKVRIETEWILDRDQPFTRMVDTCLAGS